MATILIVEGEREVNSLIRPHLENEPNRAGLSGRAD
jgi:hypothetical protein